MSVCVGVGLWLYINRGALWLTIPYFKLLFIAQKDTPVPAGHHFAHGFQMVLTWKSDLPGTLTSWSNIVFMEIIFRFEGQSIWGSNLRLTFDIFQQESNVELTPNFWLIFVNSKDLTLSPFWGFGCRASSSYAKSRIDHELFQGWDLRWAGGYWSLASSTILLHAFFG